MATAALLRDMYVRIGFTIQMATAITGTQLIDDLDELENLHDKDVEKVCKAFESYTGDLAGTFYSLNKLSKKEKAKLVADHFLSM